jgi:hypothetical protein
MTADDLKIGLLNLPEIIDGKRVLADGPRWDAEWYKTSLNR